MQFRPQYTVLFLFFAAKLFCQDIIVKKDSTKTEAKTLEIRPTEIKYKLSNYQDGPLYIVSKNEIAYVIYSNGTKEIFKEVNETVKTDSFYYAKPIVWKGDTAISKQYIEAKIGDYIKFNLQGSITVYSAFSNVPRKNDIEMTSSDEYLPVSTKQNVTFNSGFNFLFGASPYVKHVFGVNYLRTKSEYYHNYGSIGYSSLARYNSKIDFLNIVTGLRFTLFKKLHLEPLIAINFVIHSRTIRSGTETNFDYRTPPYTRYTRSFENESSDPSVGTTISLIPKISYDLPIKKIKMEAYISYNLALRYRLPWYQFGVHIFPFKKLR